MPQLARRTLLLESRSIASRAYSIIKLLNETNSLYHAATRRLDINPALAAWYEQ